MEESDEPDQRISAKRQEIRKRRTSQPMVDKSQQTEVTDKKKHLPIPQSSGPKATLSIGNIPGSKVNHESFRISAQLQQTWTKRKLVQDRKDKSLQTDTTAEEKQKVIKSVGAAVAPEEKPAAVRAAAPEFPESVQEVEIPPSHSIQLKIDRSQQTSCTGDWTLIIIPQIEKVDKEQQTYFSESEIVAFGRSSSSFSKSKEGVQQHKSSGKIFINEHPEFQPPTSSKEDMRQKSISRSSFSQQMKKGTPVLLNEQDIPAEVQPPRVEEAPDELQSPLAEEASAEEAPAKVESIPAEESLSEKPCAEVQFPPAEEASTEVQYLPTEEAPEEEAPAEVQSLPAEEASAEVQYLPTEEASAEVQYLPVDEAPEEEAPAEVQSLPAEEASAEVQYLPVDEAPEEEAPAEVQSLPAEEASNEVQYLPTEEASAEVQYLPVDEAPEEEAPAEVQSLPAEEASTEVQYLPTEEASAEVQYLPVDEAPEEEAPAEVHSLPAEEASAEIQYLPAEDAPE
ncbi:fibrous sheath CABYR-binding protein [Hipposideros larvatus]